MKTIILHPNFRFLEKKIIIEKEIFNLGKIDFNIFPDSWPNIFIKNIKEEIENKEVIYLWDFSKPEYLFTNYSLIRSLILYKVKKLDIFIPFYPVATMEKISNFWEVATSKYFADIISHIPSWINKKTTIHIFDLHTLEQQFFFNDFYVNIELHSMMNVIKDKINKETIIIFPDEGAKKRFDKEFKDYKKLYCSKIRDWNNRIINLNWWSVEWKEVIIIDDLIQSGWTIIKTAEILRNKWAKKIYAFATHWVFPNKSFLYLSKSLDKLFVTDSIPKQYERLDNMEILSIYENIKNICKK